MKPSTSIIAKTLLAITLALIVIVTLISAEYGSDIVYIAYILCLGMTLASSTVVERTGYPMVFSALSLLIPFVPLFFVRIVYGLDSEYYSIKKIPFGTQGITGYICFTIISAVIIYIGWVIYKNRKISQE